jgi:tetratricopeptide (TPR) repeat protein
MGRPNRKWKIEVALLLAAVVALSGCNKFKSRDKVRSGNGYFKVGKYETALALYKQALELDPNEAKLYKNIGVTYLSLYQPGSKHPKDLDFAQKAIDNLKKYIEAYPEDKKATELLVTTYLRAERVDDALAFFQDWVKKNPGDPKAIETLANLYFQKADFAHGVEMMENAMKISGPKKETYETIGAQAWDKAHNYPDLTDEQRQAAITLGIDALNKALALDTNYTEALSFINLLYREQAKLDEKTDKAKAAEDIAKADEYRAKAIELINKKKQAEKPAATAPGK